MFYHCVRIGFFFLGAGKIVEERLPHCVERKVEGSVRLLLIKNSARSFLCERVPPPIASRRTRWCSTQAGHTSTVCCTWSSGRSTQWCQQGVSFRRIRNRNLPKQPYPVRIFVSRNVRTPWRLSSHSSKSDLTIGVLIDPKLTGR